MEAEAQMFNDNIFNPTVKACALWIKQNIFRRTNLIIVNQILTTSTSVDLYQGPAFWTNQPYLLTSANLWLLKLAKQESNLVRLDKSIPVGHLLNPDKSKADQLNLPISESRIRSLRSCQIWAWISVNQQVYSEYKIFNKIFDFCTNLRNVTLPDLICNIPEPELSRAWDWHRGDHPSRP